MECSSKEVEIHRRQLVARPEDLHPFVVQIKIAGIGVLEKSEVHENEVDRAESPAGFSERREERGEEAVCET
jgi:hypothetical protein